MFDVICVPVDGSEYGDNAVDVAIEIAQKFSSKIAAVHVLEEFSLSSYASEEDSGDAILAKITKKADILVVAIGKKHFITRDMVKRGSVIIDVGINRVDGKLYGDVDFNDVYPKVKKITPVPGGVGPMTVVMLMQNVYDAYENMK